MDIVYTKVQPFRVIKFLRGHFSHTPFIINTNQFINCMFPLNTQFSSALHIFQRPKKYQTFSGFLFHKHFAAYQAALQRPSVTPISQVCSCSFVYARMKLNIGTNTG